MAADILIYSLLAVLAGMIVIPFVIGFVRGPDSSPARPAAVGEAALRPLGRVAGVYGRYLALYILAAGFTLSNDRAGSFCASTPVAAPGTWAGTMTRPGATLVAADSAQVCAAHPGAAQWCYYLMARLAGPVLLATVLILIWQLVREAGRGGPFTARTVTVMWRLGAVVLAGSALAGAVSRLGNDLLASTLLTSPPYLGVGVVVDAVVSGGLLHGLLPIPALAGAGLLSFARITGAGVALDEEVKATV